MPRNDATLAANQLLRPRALSGKINASRAKTKTQNDSIITEELGRVQITCVVQLAATVYEG
jgi:hypothetical protein